MSSPLKQVALLTIFPPMVPGIPLAHSKPLSPLFTVSKASLLIYIEAPTSIKLSFIKRLLNLSLITMPS